MAKAPSAPSKRKAGSAGPASTALPSTDAVASAGSRMKRASPYPRCTVARRSNALPWKPCSTTCPLPPALNKGQYPLTRKWAAAIHAQSPDIQGMCWTSRQDDGARAVILFGDRISPGALEQVGASRSLIGDSAAYGELLDLAEKIGVNIVTGKS